MGYIIVNNSVLLVKHKKENRLMSCGGKVEKDETLLEALKREIKEELNLDVEIISPVPINHVIKESDECKRDITEFVCKVNSLDDIKIKEDELDGYELVTKDNISSFELNYIQKEVLSNIFNEFID